MSQLQICLIKVRFEGSGRCCCLFISFLSIFSSELHVPGELDQHGNQMEITPATSACCYGC